VSDTTSTFTTLLAAILSIHARQAVERAGATVGVRRAALVLTRGANACCTAKDARLQTECADALPGTARALSSAENNDIMEPSWGRHNGRRR
jgi:hypothetical protein